VDGTFRSVQNEANTVLRINP